jgi:uncharacterized protein (UPF0332 family)
MNDKKSLFLYRLSQAEETIAEAQKMFDDNFSPRSIINRAYYAMFYIVLALFLKNEINIKTSKHRGKRKREDLLFAIWISPCKASKDRRTVVYGCR